MPVFCENTSLASGLVGGARACRQASTGIPPQYRPAQAGLVAERPCAPNSFGGGRRRMPQPP